MKLCFDPVTLFPNISSLSCTVLWQRSANKFARNSISARDFCKDVKISACFGTFGRKRAGLIMKTLKNRKFDAFWLTLMPGLYCWAYCYRHKGLKNCLNLNRPFKRWSDTLCWQEGWRGGGWFKGTMSPFIFIRTT